MVDWFVQRFCQYFILQSTNDEWRIIFIIGTVVYIVPAFIFTAFGSGEIQYWNHMK